MSGEVAVDVQRLATASLIKWGSGAVLGLSGFSVGESNVNGLVVGIGGWGTGTLCGACMLVSIDALELTQEYIFADLYFRG